MASNKIQLTESELHELVNEAVQQILIDEGIWDSIKGGASALGTMAKKGFENGVGRFQTSMNDKMQRFGQKVANANRKVRAAGSGVYNTMKAGAINANIQAAKNNAIKALNNFLQVAQKSQGIVGSNTLSSVQQCLTSLNRAGGRSSARLSGSVNSTLGKFGLK